jgi:hypothetical protein
VRVADLGDSGEWNPSEAVFPEGQPHRMSKLCTEINPVFVESKQPELAAGAQGLGVARK